jgi:hypothetical protein
LHPNYLRFTRSDADTKPFSDLIGEHGLPEQRRLLAEGKNVLVCNGVQRVIAFRAGCFGASRDTLQALKELGFLIDSSYNQAYLGRPCLLEDMEINDIHRIGDITEFPITNFIECAKLRRKRFMPLDVNGVSFEEMEFVLNQAKAGRPYNITIILHSFSFIKPYDVQYNKVKPRWHVIRRFKKLCRFLSENSDGFEVKTFGSLDTKQLSEMIRRSVHTFPKVPARLSLMRGLQQLRDNLF